MVVGVGNCPAATPEPDVTVSRCGQRRCGQRGRHPAPSKITWIDRMHRLGLKILSILLIHVRNFGYSLVSLRSW